jgi:hypothetical protein
MAVNEMLSQIIKIMVIIAQILIAISLFFIFYPIISGKICSWNPPCELKEGFDCKSCPHNNKNTVMGIFKTVIAVFSFGLYKG